MGQPRAGAARPGRIRAAVIFVLVFLAVAASAGAGWYFLRDNGPPVIPAPPPVSSADIPAQVHQFCGACHAYPPAETFPRSAWKEEVERGYSFFASSDLRVTPPPIAQVIQYYEERAPERLPPAHIERATTPLPVSFAPVRFPA